MHPLTDWISSHRVQRTWTIRVRAEEGFTLVEVTDPSFLWVNVDDLLKDVIALAFEAYPVLAVSQYVDREQWQIGEPQVFLQSVSQDFSLPFLLSSDFESTEELNLMENNFVMHLLGRPERDWLEKVIGFGMAASPGKSGLASNPNVLYGLPAVPEDWQARIAAWNGLFRRWFDQGAGPEEIQAIVEQVGLFGYTADGHIVLGPGNSRELARLLELLARLAEARSLELDLVQPA